MKSKNGREAKGLVSGADRFKAAAAALAGQRVLPLKRGLKPKPP